MDTCLKLTLKIRILTGTDGVINFLSHFQIQELEALQQLQQLQQQAAPFFLREIPNKPPPPYTPPKSPSSSATATPGTTSNGSSPTATSSSGSGSGSTSSPSGSPRTRGPRHGHGHGHAHAQTGHRLSKADLQRLALEACRVRFFEKYVSSFHLSIFFHFTFSNDGLEIALTCAQGSSLIVMTID
jgi:hypothetical protein